MSALGIIFAIMSVAVVLMGAAPGAEKERPGFGAAALILMGAAIFFGIAGVGA